jgi:hypothetical protein
MTSLFDPIDLGDLHLGNRVFMAPMTRKRARPDGTLGPWAEAYYRQRMWRQRPQPVGSDEACYDFRPITRPWSAGRRLF